MNTIQLHNTSESAYTLISNTFIDEFMPYANGAFVKVYLTLVRMLSNAVSNFSVSTIADKLELTENDIIRSFSYWEKQSLLSINKDINNNISQISLLTPERKEKKEPTTRNTPAMRSYSAKEIASVAKNTEFKWIVTIVEKYMERTLSPTDVELIVYLYDSLHFSADLIFHLYEYCISRGKDNVKYIQTVAFNWHEEGIDTVAKAMDQSTNYDKNYIEVMKTFGLNQTPAPVQKKYIDNWFQYGFSVDLIKEACNRTLLAIHEPNFKYTNGILEKWKSLGITSFEQIQTLDKEHAAKNTYTYETTTKKATPKKNSFNSYEQRSYTKQDYSSLEEQLLSK